jgi:hypothetical protein
MHPPPEVLNETVKSVFAATESGIEIGDGNVWSM